MAQIQYQFNKNDEYFTPAYVVYPIMEGKTSLQGVPFQSGYLCSGICEKQLEFEYLVKQ